MLTKQEADCFIKLELKSWGLKNYSWEWASFSHLGEAHPNKNKIKLSPRILSSSALLIEIVKHEIAHCLDWNERGTFIRNGKNDFHGKNWKKYCLLVGCRPRRLIPL